MRPVRSHDATPCCLRAPAGGCRAPGYGVLQLGDDGVEAEQPDAWRCRQDEVRMSASTSMRRLPPTSAFMLLLVSSRRIALIDMPRAVRQRDRPLRPAAGGRREVGNCSTFGPFSEATPFVLQGDPAGQPQIVAVGAAQMLAVSASCVQAAMAGRRNAAAISGRSLLRQYQRPSDPC